MAKASPIFQSFNGGEFSPHLDGRVDQDKYYTGCRLLANFIPLIPGPAVRRGGTRFIAEVKNSTNRTWLSTFQFSQDQSYVLEWGTNYIRFFVNRGQLLDGAVPFEMTTSLGAGQLISPDGTFALQTAQSADILFITHTGGEIHPKELRRRGATDWTYKNYGNKEGPFKDLDSDNEITLQASDATGDITLTASDDVFEAGHDGALVYLEPENLAAIFAWKPGETGMTHGLFRRNAGNIYEVSAGEINKTSGAAPPIHERGTGNDGGANFDYLHSNYGIAEITAITSPTVAQATVIKRLPDEASGVHPVPKAGVVSNPTKWWAFGAWSTQEGWPSSICLYKERLLFGKGRTLFGSRVGNFYNHNRKTGPDITPDAAFVLNMATEGVDEIRWMLPIHNELGIGTAGSEIVVQSATANQAFSAENATAIEQTNYGAKRLPAIRVGNVALFCQRAGNKLREYRFTLEEDQYIAPDLTVLADHIAQAGIIDYCFQQEPASVVWVVTNDGELLGLTHNRDRGVVGWHRHPLGGNGQAEACAAIPRPDGTGDDLWLIVRRVIGGQVRRYVEVMEPPLRDSESKDDAFYVDSGTTYEIAGDPVTVFGGLNHLIGETVQILADGAVLPSQVVSALGEVRTTTPVERKAHIGLQYVSRLQTMRIEAGGTGGTAQGKLKRINEVVVRLVRTLGGRIGGSFDTLAEILYRDETMPQDESPTLDLYSGDKKVMVDFGWGRDGYVCLAQTQPLPMTVAAIMPVVVTSD